MEKGKENIKNRFCSLILLFPFPLFLGGKRKREKNNSLSYIYCRYSPTYLLFDQTYQKQDGQIPRHLLHTQAHKNQTYLKSSHTVLMLIIEWIINKTCLKQVLLIYSLGRNNQFVVPSMTSTAFLEKKLTINDLSYFMKLNKCVFIM